MLPSNRTRSRSGLEALTGALLVLVAVGALSLMTRAAPLPVQHGSPSQGTKIGPNARPLQPSPKAQPHLAYRLQAALDTSEQTISGEGVIRFTNISNTELPELWFHLYLNAFKNNRTLFARSPFAAGRGGGKPSVWGYVDVRSLRDTRTGQDLWPGRDRHSPGDPHDETDIRVPLEEPLLPGDSIELEIEWVSKLPEIVERTGFSQNYYFAGQWFPKLAKFDPEAPGGPTFRHFAFHPHAEFYADYADYRVELDVPSEYTVGATGSRIAEEYRKERKQLTYAVERVHDFAWTAWPRFQVHEESLAGKQLRVLYPPGHDMNLQRTLVALRFALPHFESHYGAYPYPTLTVVHPPEHARHSGGMEYPTLFTTGGAWYSSIYSRAIELVTIHELAHQWFYGLLGSDEAAWPFLDEGFTSYAEAKAAKQLFGESSAAKFMGLDVSADGYRRAFAAARGQDVPIAQPAEAFPSFSHLGALVYSRTATLLQTLEAVHGERFVATMRDYALRFRFQHPTPQDFLNVVEERLGAEVRAQVQHALFERGWVDYLVGSVQTAAASPRRGIFGNGDERETLTADTTGETEEQGEAIRHVGRVLVVRRGNLHFPVNIDLYDAQGGRLRRRWDGRDAFTFIEYEGAHPLKGAVIDPKLQIALDQNLLNNSSFLERRGGLRTFERGTYLAELLLHFLGP